jgi:hypothetical protein
MSLIVGLRRGGTKFFRLLSVPSSRVKLSKKKEPRGSPETSVSNHLKPRNNPEDQIIQGINILQLPGFESEPLGRQASSLLIMATTLLCINVISALVGREYANTLLFLQIRFPVLHKI